VHGPDWRVKSDKAYQCCGQFSNSNVPLAKTGKTLGEKLSVDERRRGVQKSIR